MDQANIQPPTEPPPVHTAPVSHKNILFLLLFALSLIVLTALTTSFVLQSQRSPPSQPQTIVPTIIPTHYESNQPYPLDSDNTYETANWKTYTNDQLNFEIKFPSDWNPVESSSNFPNIVSYKAPDQSQFQIQVENNKNFTLEEYLEDLDKQNETGWEGEKSVEVKKSSQVFVNNIPGKERLEDKLPAGFTTIVTYVLKSDKVYIFTVLPFGDKPPTDQEANQKYYKILSTFKFLDQK